MAKVLYTIAVSELVGSAGAATYARNRSGSYVKSKPIPTNPQTVRQQANRTLFATNSTAWRTLTPERRQSFIDGAVNYPYTDSFGNTYYYSGFQLFCKLNQMLSIANLSNISDLPSPVGFSAPASLSVNALDLGRMVIDFSVLNADVSDILIIYASTMKSAGVNVLSPSAYILMARSASVGSGQFALFNDWTTEFGALTVGQRIFFKMIAVSYITGQASLPVYCNGLVT